MLRNVNFRRAVVSATSTSSWWICYIYGRSTVWDHVYSQEVPSCKMPRTNEGISQFLEYYPIFSTVYCSSLYRPPHHTEENSLTFTITTKCFHLLCSTGVTKDVFDPNSTPVDDLVLLMRDGWQESILSRSEICFKRTCQISKNTIVSQVHPEGTIVLSRTGRSLSRTVHRTRTYPMDCESDRALLPR